MASFRISPQRAAKSFTMLCIRTEISWEELPMIQFYSSSSTWTYHCKAQITSTTLTHKGHIHMLNLLFICMFWVVLLFSTLFTPTQGRHKQICGLGAYLSGFISIRNSDAIRSIWDVVIRLIFVDVLQKKRRKKNRIKNKDGGMRCKENPLTRVEVRTHSAERKGERLQDVQHCFQHTAAPQQVREARITNTSGVGSELSLSLVIVSSCQNVRISKTAPKKK